MSSIDFSSIRIHNGSQAKGFEELVCQLAHLNPPGKTKHFIRKEGDGGDAGVECYWVLEDGSEHAWQAKYFLDVVTDAQWRQVNKSVETALDKHPNLKKYYVCIPRDHTDSRKVIKGTQSKGSFDKWNNYVKKWEELATSKKMKVEFVYWGEHEIIQMLLPNTPECTGRLLYWFDEACISSETLQNIADKSKGSLGERFTPEFHVELPIAQKFDCIGLTPQWTKNLEKEIVQLGDLRSELKESLAGCTDCLKNEDPLQVTKEMNDLYTILLEKVQWGTFLNDVEIFRENCHTIIKRIQNCIDDIDQQIRREETEETKKKWREKSNNLWKSVNQMNNFYDFLMDDAIKVGKARAMLLSGEAGIGKSHLLCDITLQRLEIGLPTIFVLGAQYPGGNPLDFICSKLGLPNQPYRTVLGALDALGESKGTRTLIIIDAINEGVNREAWFDFLIGFLDETKDFSNIAVVISCRSTYKEFLIPDNVLGSKIFEIKHHGFRGFEHRATLNYLSKQGIPKPGMPVLMPEFSNPLFLKTCCKAIKSTGKHEFPKGLNGFKRLYEFYLESINNNIRIKKRYRTRRSIVLEAVNKFAEEIYPTKLYGIEVGIAKNTINQFDLNPHIGESLFNLLIDEGIIAYDVKSEGENGTRGIEIVRFTYERFSDYAIAEHILKECHNEQHVAELFSNEGEIGKLLSNQELYRYGGIIEALGLIIPEKTQKEFLEFVDIDEADESHQYQWLFDKTFAETILWRTGESISEKSLELLNEIESIGYGNSIFDILLSLSTEPNHPWNADFLDKNLRKWKLPTRDSVWSTYLAINDISEEEYGDDESIIRTLIDWSAKAKLDDVEPERLRLIAIALLWMTTTSNRKVRDQATKSLARVFYYIPERIVEIIKQFNNCDDAYLVERLYAAVYGATTTNLLNSSYIKDIAESIYEMQFKDGTPYPDILLRDYARGVMELAFSKNLLEENIKPKSFRPPYKSVWPIENPSAKEIDDLTGDEYTSSIRSSLMGFPGDFGNYTMSCVHDWSITPISSPRHETGFELMKEFSKKLSLELRADYLKFLEYQVQAQKLRELNIKEWIENISASGIWDDSFEQEEENEDEENTGIN